MALYERMRTQLLQSIDSHMEREVEIMQTNYVGSEMVPMDDVSGWRALETSLLALQAVADGCGARLKKECYHHYLLDDMLKKGVYSVAVHKNRHVRQAAMNTARVLLDRTGLLSVLDMEDAIKLAKVLAMGMQDPWPQVVFAASGAVRSLMCAVNSGDYETLRSHLLPILVPRMCLNRYYVPEGVQALSQKTWEMVMRGEGRLTVGELANVVANYYTEACQMDNHFSRVAACYAMAELASKVDPHAVEHESSRLMEAAATCLQVSRVEKNRENGDHPLDEENNNIITPPLHRIFTGKSALQPV